MQRTLFLFLFSVCTIACGASSGSLRYLGHPSFESLPEARLEELIESFRAARPSDSLSVGIWRNGEVWTRHYGLSREGGAAPTDSTLYEIGSITKTYTGLLLADMILRGEVRIDQPVRELLPANWTVPSFEGVEITLEHLATHSSGLPPDWPGTLVGENDLYGTVSLEVLRTSLAQVTVATRPGTSVEYNNLAIALLGQALALHKGTTFEALLRERVIAPLGLRDIHFAPNHENEARRAQPHATFGVATTDAHLLAVAPAGAILSNVVELLRYASLYTRFEGSLSSAAALATLPRMRVNEHADLGLTWGIGMDGAFRGRRIGHAGGTLGSRSHLVIDRNAGFAVTVLSNTGDAPVELLLAAIVGVLDGSDEVISFESNAVSLTAEQRAALEGNYRISEDFTLSILDRDGRLFAQGSGQPAFEVTATSPTEMTISGSIGLSFELDEIGRARALVLHQDGDHRGERIAD